MVLSANKKHGVCSLSQTMNSTHYTTTLTNHPEKHQVLLTKCLNINITLWSTTKRFDPIPSATPLRHAPAHMFGCPTLRTRWAPLVSAHWEWRHKGRPNSNPPSSWGKVSKKVLEKVSPRRMELGYNLTQLVTDHLLTYICIYNYIYIYISDLLTYIYISMYIGSTTPWDCCFFYHQIS